MKHKSKNLLVNLEAKLKLINKNFKDLKLNLKMW